MSITIHSDSKYKQYENLLLEKDQIQKEANQYQGLYLHHFGEKIVTLYRLKVECIRLKRKFPFFNFKSIKIKVLIYIKSTIFLNMK